MVGARAGAIPEVVGDAAVLVDPRSVEGFAQALLDLHRDTERRGQMCERGRRRASRFTWPAVAGRTIDVYRRVLSADDGVIGTEAPA